MRTELPDVQPTVQLLHKYGFKYGSGWAKSASQRYLSIYLFVYFIPECSGVIMFHPLVRFVDCVCQGSKELHSSAPLSLPAEFEWMARCVCVCVAK